MKPFSPSGIGQSRGVSPRRALINYAIFAVVAVTIGWAGVALDQATGSPHGNSLGMGLWLLIPAVVAVLLFLSSPDGAGPLGLTLRFKDRTRWFGLAAIFFLPYTAIIVLAGALSGVGTFHGGASGAVGLLVAMAMALPALLLKNTVEEFSWRGFGTRTAAAIGLPRLGTHVLVGVTWGLWHLPFYVYFLPRIDLLATTSLPWALFIPVFFGGVIATAVVLGELRLRTGSIWPGVLMHSVGGAVVNTLILGDYLSYTGHGDAFFSPVPNSIGSIVLMGLLGYALLRRRPQPRGGPAVHVAAPVPTQA